MKIGIISDIHEDIKRLKEAFSILDRNKCSKIVCLGDFVGYSVPYYGFLWSRNAHDVIDRIKKRCDLVLVGNHDLFSVRKLPKNKAGFKYPQDWYSMDYQTRKKISKDKVNLYEYNELSPLLTKQDEKYIEKLPEYAVKSYGGLKILFSHYAYPDLVGTTTFEPKTPGEVKSHFDFMKKHGCTLGISGHDHKEGIMIFNKDKVAEFPFNKLVKLTSSPTWLHGPSVVNGSFANGVLVLDTEKMEIKALPLRSKKHITPEWRKL
ncbi:MAG: metallophosphoesterase [Candidatus Woesearchaeota archaeon]